MYTPQQNGRAERKHRHILNVARALRFQANLPIDLWGECVLASAHLINRTPSSLLKNKTPFEILHGQPPSLSHLRVIGCLAYAHNKNTKGDKFASRSRKCILLGFPSGTKGWKLFDLEQKDVFVSRDVTFQEKIFPYMDNTPTETSDVLPPITLPPSNMTEDHNDSPIPSVIDEAPVSSSTPSAIDIPPETEHVDPEPVFTEIAPEPSGRGHRPRVPSTRYQDYVINTVTTIPTLTPSLPSSIPQLSSGSLFPLSDYLSYDRISSKHCSYLIAMATNIEPKHFREAMKHKVWRESMKSEKDALERQHTWDLVKLPPNKKALGTKWVYTIKLLSDGTSLVWSS